MNVVPTRHKGPAFRRSKTRCKRGIVPRGGKAPLGVRDRQLHEQLKKDGSLKSGRSGAYVYYVRKGQQRWRRYVVPRDPRTLAQQRSRAIFSAVSKTWSEDGTLTDGQRDAWYAQGAKKQSRARLGSSGKLTGQQDFVGRNCAKGQRGHGVLFHPLKPEKNPEASKARKPELIVEVTQAQMVMRSTWGTRRAYTVTCGYSRRVPRGYLRKARNRQLTSQVVVSQRFTQSTWDRPQTHTRALPG
jgi:hypothetical protein